MAPISRPKEETLAVRREKIGRNLSIGHKNHFKIMRSWKQYLSGDRAQMGKHRSKKSSRRDSA
ncbi:MAG: hypothetical protein AAF902_16205 [Chloroflexota bacterium]